jgi:hypothetical protein
VPLEAEPVAQVEVGRRLREEARREIDGLSDARGRILARLPGALARRLRLRVAEVEQPASRCGGDAGVFLGKIDASPVLMGSPVYASISSGVREWPV